MKQYELLTQHDSSKQSDLYELAEQTAAERIRDLEQALQAERELRERAEREQTPFGILDQLMQRYGVQAVRKAFSEAAEKNDPEE